LDYRPEAALLETRLPPFHHLGEVHLCHPLTSVWGRKKSQQSIQFRFEIYCWLWLYL